MVMKALSKGTAVQIVLAAGRSERMGTTKALLQFGKRSALALALDAAAGAGVEESIVVVGENASEVLAAHDVASSGTTVTWARNEEEGSEQLRSLQVGLNAIAREMIGCFFIHPVDYDRQADEIIAAGEARNFEDSLSLRQAVREDAEMIRQKFSDRVATTRDGIRDRPMETTLYALGLGVIIGMLLRR